MFKNTAYFDTLRSIGQGSLSGTYAAVGTQFTFPSVVLMFKNESNGDILISTDGSHDMIALPPNSYTVYDVRTNSPSLTDLMFPIGLQFYAKQGATAPTSGTLFIEAIIVKPEGS